MHVSSCGVASVAHSTVPPLKSNASAIGGFCTSVLRLTSLIAAYLYQYRPGPRHSTLAGTGSLPPVGGITQVRTRVTCGLIWIVDPWYLDPMCSSHRVMTRDCLHRSKTGLMRRTAMCMVPQVTWEKNHPSHGQLWVHVHLFPIVQTN